jgi:uncharacterized GH25 family protein
MRRFVGSLLFFLVASAMAQAHFPFIVPDAEGASAKVVFSDSLAPDTDVNIEKLAGTKLFLRAGAGKDTPLEWKKGEGFYAVKLPGNGSRVVYGITEYGVLQKGDAKPFRLVYYPKALLGDAEGKAIGDPLKVEIVPARSGDKTRFQVLSAGKPAADAEVTVLVPGEEKKTAKTDKEGFTPGYEAKGRYGVFARVTDAKAGEFGGRKYDETRFYATLVADIK